MEIIRCEGLSKIYQAGENKVFALDNVDLTIEQGSFTAITGPSGSGKSTLLHLLSGLDTPSKGRVIYQGKNLYDYKDNQLSVLRRRRFGFVFQSYNLVRELTGWENILLPVMLDNRKADEEHLNRIIDLLMTEYHMSEASVVSARSKTPGHIGIQAIVRPRLKKGMTRPEITGLLKEKSVIIAVKFL